MAAPTDLDFEHATYEDKPAGVVCGMCKKPVTGEYWQWLGRVVCGSCRTTVGALEAQASSPATFVRASVLGGATALGCGVAYAVFVSLTHAQLALVTIGIAYVVATVIRKATNNVSGRRFQVLAVALTYVAGAMGYAPGLWRGIASGHGDIPLAALGRASIYLVGVLLAAPFLEAQEAPLGLLIIGFGLWEAWRRTRPTPMQVTGPYCVPSPVPPAAPLTTPAP